MPPELIQCIFDFLPPRDFVLFGYTCRRFYYDWPRTDVSQIRDECPKLAGLINRKVVPPVLQWCPCGAYRFTEIKKKAYEAKKTQREMTFHCDCRPRPYLTIRFSGEGFLLSHDIAVAVLPRSRIPTEDAMREYLQRQDVPLCPHVSLGTPWLMDGYHLERLTPFTEPYENKSGLASLLLSYEKCEFRAFSCRYCASFFRFFTQEIPGKKKVIHVKVTRNLGLLANEESPYWLSQLAVPKAFQLKRYWYIQRLRMLVQCRDDLNACSGPNIGKDWEDGIYKIEEELNEYAETPGQLQDTQQGLQSIYTPYYSSDKWPR